MTTCRRVLVVGYDGAPWELVDPLIERGLMPNTRRLIEGGVRGDLLSSHFPRPRRPGPAS